MSMLYIMHIHLLGDFRLVYADVDADVDTAAAQPGQAPISQINSPRLQALVAYLVLHRDAPQPRQHIAFLLWPDTTEAQARTNLRQLLHSLKQTLPQADQL